MSSGAPPHTLREAESGDQRSRVMRVLGFACLGILLTISLVLAIIGVAAKLQARAIAAEQLAALQESGSQQNLLPAACLSPSFAPRPADIWTGEQTAASEEQFRTGVEDGQMRIVGLDGFNFWGDPQSANISQALGRAPWTEQQLAQWIGYFRELNAQLQADGRQLVIVVVPAKWELYREKLPEWADGLHGKTHLDQFLERSDDLPVVDVRESLLAAKEEAPVYSAVNSHWSPYGAMAAWEQIVACGASLYPDSLWAGITAPVPTDIELHEAPNEFTPFGDESAPVDWAIAVTVSEAPPVQTTITGSGGQRIGGPVDGFVGLLDLPATTAYPGGVGTALILSDSTGEALSTIWAQTFAHTCQARHNLDNPSARPDARAEAADCDADIVIYAFTERYFAQVPPALP